MAVVTFAGLTFDGATANDGFGLSKLVGWYDAAPVREDVRPRPTSDGAFGVDRIYRDARVISVEGAWRGTDLGQAYAARDLLAAVQADGRPSVLSVTDMLGIRWCEVTLASAPQIADRLRSPFFPFAFDVVARDARKYGAEMAPFTGLPTSGTGFVWPAVSPADWGSGGDPGRVIVTNTGTAPTSPILEVTGGLSAGVELVEITTGSILRLERPIPASSTVFFNTRTQRAYLDSPSNDITSDMTRRVWWSIPAGATRTVQFNGLGAVSGVPKLTVRFSPAY